jgi:hypothetical protein
MGLVEAGFTIETRTHCGTGFSREGIGGNTAKIDGVPVVWFPDRGSTGKRTAPAGQHCPGTLNLE